MATPTKYDTLAEIVRDLQAAERKSLAAAEARRVLSPGGTRARVTTANARWANAAEHRDRTIERLMVEIKRQGLA